MFPVKGFQLQFGTGDIAGLAERYSYSDDSSARRAGAEARKLGHYTLDGFLTVCRWKTRRSEPKVVANSAEQVKAATSQALSATDEGVKMDALLSLEGVGVPTGSALLHFADPESYPILDVRALESLGRKGRGTYPVSFWVDYLTACRSLSSKCGVSIRELDKALWQWSAEQ